jgi:hypothetical protein
MRTAIPGSDTAEVVFSATVKAGYTFAGASIVVGGAGSNRSVVPLDASQPVQTVAPILGIGKGLGAGAEAGLTVRIVDSILWPDFAEGNAGAWFLDVLTELTYTSTDPREYEDLATVKLRAPAGTSSTGSLSYLFTANEGGLVPSGETHRQGYHFAVRGGSVGPYQLSFDSRAVRVLKTPGAVNPVIEFTVPSS